MSPGKDVYSGTTDTVEVEQLPQEILRANPPKVPNELYNVYELKTKPELVQFYHAAAVSD